MALVEQVGEFEPEHTFIEFILNGGIEERHVFVVVGGNLSAHMVVVERKVDFRNREQMDCPRMRQRCPSVADTGISGSRPSVVDVITHLKPGNRRGRHFSCQFIIVGAHLDDIVVDRHLAAAESVVRVEFDFRVDGGEILRGGEMETGGAGMRVAQERVRVDVYPLHLL